MRRPFAVWFAAPDRGVAALAVALVLLFALPQVAFGQAAPLPGASQPAKVKPGRRHAPAKRGAHGFGTAPVVAGKAAPGAVPGAPGADGPELPAVEKAAIDCPDKIPPGKRFKLEFRGEVELKDLITWASATLCRPVLVPTTIRQQKIQIYAPSTTTLPEAYRIFLAALNTMGLTVQPEGSALVIIETAHAKESTIPMIGADGRTPNDAAFVTKIIHVRDVSPDDVATVLSRIKSKDGDIVTYAPTGMLIITDASENVMRMEQIIKLVDVPMGSEKIWTVKLRNTKAADIASLLEKIFQPKGGAGGGGGGGSGGGAARRPAQGQSSVSTPGAGGGEGADAASVSLIVAEEKVNMLVIVANEKTYRRMLALIMRLEQSAAGPVDAAADRVHIYPLANALAEDIATTLAGLGVSTTRGGARPTTGAPGTPGTTPTSSSSSSSSSTTGAGGNASGLFEGDVKVASDKPTNSLVIIAGGKDYYTLRDIIRKLDMSRKQVFIEATILEVTLDKTRKLGAAFHAGDSANTLNSANGQSLLFGGSEPNSSTNSIAFSPLTLAGLAAGIRGPAIPGADTILGLPPGTSVPGFGVYLQALQNNNDVNVVSLPHILTTDNEKANIEIGQNLPFPGMLGGGGLGALSALAGGATGATGGALGGLGLGTSVQRQDVALKLEITPHIGNDDMVRLEIDNEISDVSSPNYNGLGPATNKRKVKTTITVRDQQPVVLGGLIKDRISESVDKVPLLGDIPLLGYLFKYTSREISKQNLLIIITPYVIKDPQDLRRIFERKVQERREFLERFSAFRDDNTYEAAVDYRHKRGLLEEINRTAVDVEREAADLRTAEQNARARVFEGPVELPPTAVPVVPMNGKTSRNNPVEPPAPPPVFAPIDNTAPPPPPPPTAAPPPLPAPAPMPPAPLPPSPSSDAPTRGEVN